MFEKGARILSGLPTILCSEERFCRPLKKVRVEISILLTGFFPPNLFAVPVQTYLFYI
jgi:hypothetical protein